MVQGEGCACGWDEQARRQMMHLAQRESSLNLHLTQRKKKKKTFSKTVPRSLANRKTVLKQMGALIWCNIRERWSHGGCGRAPVAAPNPLLQNASRLSVQSSMNPFVSLLDIMRCAH